MSVDREKTDGSLGMQVRQYLTSCGVETPMDSPHRMEGKYYVPVMTDKDQMDQIREHFEAIMRVLGLNLNDESMADTPTRVAKMFVNEMFWGLNYENFPKCMAIENDMRYDEMVMEKNISVMSVCEHHWGAIEGTATVAYIPNTKIVGLSKLNRIVEFFSRRPQIQERLTEQIFHAMKFILETENIAVLIDADHQCVRSRGVKDVNSRTVTSKLGGLFKNTEARSEFMNLATKG